jgi:dTDP-4-dehydrorhamnose reductase
MKALITGGGGQLGRALTATAPAEASVRSLGRAELDIADRSALERVVRDLEPALIINAAGFTRVDDAEKEAAAAERANATGPAVLAALGARSGAWLVQVSTDYVFDGEQCRPYATDARTNPLSVYGRTKLAGELAVRGELPARSTIVRTSWVYSAAGRNFLTTMLRLMKERPQLRVVSDQIGAPTATSGLARTIWALAQRQAAGLYHWCDSGVASWYDFAVAIAEEARGVGVLSTSPTILPISSAEYPTAARRPPFSLLDKRETERVLGVTAPHWRCALRETLRELASAGGAR